MSSKTIENILSDLEQRGDILKNWRQVIASETHRMSLAGPWHTQLLIGFGAWLSSLLFIGFLSVLGMTVGGFGIYGILLLGASLALSKLKEGTFQIKLFLPLVCQDKHFLSHTFRSAAKLTIR